MFLTLVLCYYIAMIVTLFLSLDVFYISSKLNCTIGFAGFSKHVTQMSSGFIVLDSRFNPVRGTE